MNDKTENIIHKTEIETLFLHKIYDLLVDGHYYADWTLEDHDKQLGRTTRRNKFYAKILEDQLSDYDEAINKIKGML